MVYETICEIVCEIACESSIDEINNSLAGSEVMSIEDYIDCLNHAGWLAPKKLFPSVAGKFDEDFDTFAKDMLGFLLSGKCRIPHDRLNKYDVGTLKRSNDALNMLERNEYVLGKDYIIETERGPGGLSKKYLLHPDTFDSCVKRNRKSRAAAIHYDRLKKYISAYDKYQIACEKAKNVELLAENDRLRKLVDNLQLGGTPKQAESKSTDSKSMESKSTESKQAKSKNSEPKPESRPTESKGSESKQARVEQARAEQIDVVISDEELEEIMGLGSDNGANISQRISEWNNHIEKDWLDELIG